jgi:peptide/nickel transport system substrate-binding protein
MPVVGYHSDFIALRMNDVIKDGEEETFKPTKILGNKDVRRALMIGLDRQTIMEATVIEGDIYGWPINGDFKSVYTPVSELPASTQELFEYDTAKAKKMLADAGYPDGFTLKMILTAGQNDVANLIVDMWSDIGVETEMQMLEDVAWENARRSREGYDVLIRGEPTSDPLVIFPAIFLNGRGQAVYNNEYMNAQYDIAARNPDVNVRNDIFKELGVMAIDDVPYIPLATGFSKIYYWPWVKNYYGLIEESAWGTSHMNARIWIDQALKKQLGY